MNKFRDVTAQITQLHAVDLSGGDFNISTLSIPPNVGVYIVNAQGTDTATVEIIALHQPTEASFVINRGEPNLRNTMIRTIKAGSGTTAIDIIVGW